ncbi:hypothetical protein NQT62_02125 [Limnobacter humi]|uniref:Uncharacterized protein n=1 Tax=Limnobacter humi TaxID=1778671 RepID=A0ABT1WCI8_9BURK|nr:hypothetical protein [Limnobacter humi]MCQ8895234.1 hypothetical protein [Limnobacter humi]
MACLIPLSTERGLLALIFFASLLTTWYWTNYPGFLPDVPEWLGLKLVQLYGAENAEQIADLEVIVGLVVSWIFYSAIAVIFLGIRRAVAKRDVNL